MGKRPRTPHFITGIGDGNVHDGKSNNNKDISRLRGNKDGNNSNSNSNGNINSNGNGNSNSNNEDLTRDSNKDNGYNSRHNHGSHNSLNDQRHIRIREELLHRMDGEDGGTYPADSWIDAFHDRKTAIPVMDLNLENIGNRNSAMGIGIDVNGIVKPVDSTGPWQVSAFTFLGAVVVIAIVLHFVAETSSGASNNHKNKSIDKDSSSNRHHTGTNSRPYQYRRRQRQRRMQKLRKKKTDEWSDDEEPIQDGIGQLSTSNSMFSSFTGIGDGRTEGNTNSNSNPFDGGYGSPDPDPYEYDQDYNEYENEYDNNNRSVYHQSDYYQEPNSYLSSQDISLRRTGNNTKDSYDYYATNSQTPAPAMGKSGAGSNRVGVVPTYRSPSASKYLMEPTTTSSAKLSSLVFRPSTTATTPQRGISPMNSYSSAGSDPRQRQQQQRPRQRQTNYSSNDSVSSPIWEMEKNGNRSSNSSNSNVNVNGKNHGRHNNNAVTATTPSWSSNQTPSSGRLRMPSTPETYTVGSALSWQHDENDDTNTFQDDLAVPSSLLQQPKLMTSPKDNSVDEFDLGIVANRPTELGAARLLYSGSRFSSFASIRDIDGEGSQHSPNKNVENEGLETSDDRETASGTWSHHSGSGYGEIENIGDSPTRSQYSHHSHHSRSSNNNNVSPSASTYSTSAHSHLLQDMHQKSLLLTPGNCEATPRIGNARKTIAFGHGAASSLDAAALLPFSGTSGTIPIIPFVPHLEEQAQYTDTGLSPVLFTNDPPPRSVIMDELRLVEMETGNSTHWNIDISESSNNEDQSSFAGDYDDDQLDRSAFMESSDHGSASYDGSDISIPSGDPRKNIVHKRRNLTMATDAATSLQSSIDFDELQLQEVIGGGGFGQVWKAIWRGTPVAVKVLTGSAQNTHVARAILEEFKAEINLLKGMRHPNICLYMGACVTPPNRAIITELAANGSAWDSLRLPLMPPYTAADGTHRGSWPLSLYLPGQHGVPPGSHGSALSSHISAPIPPRGTWPWELVKRVSCGAARGMAYLHSGNPPVLHRDLKSANLLLDESYTTKVCDFGLSRLKAQTRSMTANCGTVQWMAPEVLANKVYDEKADVYSFGIIVWELLSRECPYEGMTAIQCALAVLNRDKRPEIPKWCPPGLHALIKSCIKKDPASRPTFTEVIVALDALN